jgi:hypothetical protein
MRRGNLLSTPLAGASSPRPSPPQQLGQCEQQGAAGGQPAGLQPGAARQAPAMASTHNPQHPGPASDRAAAPPDA